MTDEIRKIEAADRADRGTPEQRGAIGGRFDYGINLRLIRTTDRLYPGLPRHDDTLSYSADPVFLDLYEGRNYSGITKVRTSGPSGIQRSVHDNVGPGGRKWREASGLISRRGYIRIFREDIGVIERDVWISELKALAKKLLTGRSLTLFERRVIGPLEDPHSPQPSIADLAIEFGISEQRVYKVVTKCWKKIEAAHRAAQAKEDAPIMLNTFTTKRQTGGINFQSEGRFVDASELPKAYSYSTSVNSAASAASTRDLKNEDE